MIFHQTWFIDQACVASLSSAIGLFERREWASGEPASVVWAASRDRERVTRRREQALREFGGRWRGSCGGCVGEFGPLLVKKPGTSKPIRVSDFVRMQMIQ